MLSRGARQAKSEAASPGGAACWLPLFFEESFEHLRAKVRLIARSQPREQRQFSTLRNLRSFCQSAHQALGRRSILANKLLMWPVDGNS